MSKKLSSKRKAFHKQAQKRFAGLKSKYFSKTKYLSKNAFKAKIKSATNKFYKKVKSRFSGLRSKYFFSKLKKNFISKTSKLTKIITTKIVSRTTVQSCDKVKRSKRGVKRMCAFATGGISKAPKTQSKFI